jgi:radical SAM protein with 4Fe4S-binding SPASM domain
MAQRWWERAAGWVREDFRAAGAHLRGRGLSPAPGLYHYRIEGPSGRVRLHLRLHPDRGGLLFINAVEVIHLPPTAAEMAREALEGRSRASTLARLRAAYPRVPAERLAGDYDRLAAALARLGEPAACCHAGTLGLAQPLPFSVRAAAPYKADLAVTYECNNACGHCYNSVPRGAGFQPASGGTPAAEWRAGSPPHADGWRNILDKLWSLGVPYVIFTGGEPTLREDLPELVAHAEGLGMIAGLNTNGRRLADPALCGALAQAGLDHVQITLNSARPAVHDRISGAPAWEETVAGIRQALAAGLHVLTNTTLLRDNAGEAARLPEFLHRLGLRTFAMNGVIHSGCGTGHPGALPPEELPPVLESVRARAGELGMRFLWYTPTEYCRLHPVEAGVGLKSCNAAEYSICVEPNGDVLPCQSYYRAAGNLLRDPWESIWEGELFTRLRHRRERPGAAGLARKCWDCEELRVCGGGCRLEGVSGGGAGRAAIAEQSPGVRPSITGAIA